MSDLWSLEFMRVAVVAAIFTGLAAPAVGTYLVQRRLALMGDGIGHVAVTGVALGLLTNTSPAWTAIVVAVCGAVVIEVVRERGHASGDVALALLFYGGIAGGVLLTGLAGQSAATLQAFLFGSLLTLDSGDLWFSAGLAAVTVTIAVGLCPQLYAVALDPEYAKLAGLRVRYYNILVAVLAAVTVSLAMRTVGLLLVSAMMVVPVATAQQVTRSFRSTLVAAMALGALVAVGGLAASAWLSFDYNLPVAPGPAIVMVALAGFVLAWPVGGLLRRRDRRRAPFPAVPGEAAHVPSETDHSHLHGPDCGHRAVPHGDHVDYLHDGHRHAPHGHHYDEH
ncbi:MAG: metal ABC transporter permease [Nocardioides sp.]